MSGFAVFKNVSQYSFFASERNPFTFHETIFMVKEYHLHTLATKTFLE
jgi:hypothetical protein